MIEYGHSATVHNRFSRDSRDNKSLHVLILVVIAERNKEPPPLLLSFCLVLKTTFQRNDTGRNAPSNGPTTAGNAAGAALGSVLLRPGVRHRQRMVRQRGRRGLLPPGEGQTSTNRDQF